MTDQELRDIVASLAVTHQKIAEEMDRLQIVQEARHQKLAEELDKLKSSQEETGKQIEKTWQQLREQGKQIGGLGNKFGGFTEAMAIPSMEKLLRRKFKMQTVASRVREKINGEELELDLVAYANGDVNSVYIVEVKSLLREDSLIQVQESLEKFRRFHPEHEGKHLYGIIALVDGSSKMERKALEAGFYLARIHDDIFEMATPKGFKPRDFSQILN